MGVGVSHPNAYELLRHFVLFFLLPTGSVVFSAILAAVLYGRIRRAFFARYATPEELIDDALGRLKKDERRGAGGGGPRPGLYSSASRETALDLLRLVIKLRGGSRGGRPEKSDLMVPYTVLASELFYGELSNGSPEGGGGGSGRGGGKKPVRPRRRGDTLTADRSLRSAKDLPPALVECQEVIKEGLDLDSTNQLLLNLQDELQLIRQYGKNGRHAKMITVGRHLSLG